MSNEREIPSRCFCNYLGKRSFSPLINARAEDFCEEKLTQEINKLVSKDSDGILAMQFELTSLKMAAYARKNNRKTLEGLANKKKIEINQNQKITEELKSLYKNFGEKEDFAEIDNFLASIKSKSPKFIYKDKKNRLEGELSSSFMQALRVASPDANIEQEDVAITWLSNKVSLTRKKTTMSEAVVKINAFELWGPAQTNKEIKERETLLTKSISDVFEKTKNDFLTNYSMCADKSAIGSCVTTDLIKK